MYRRFRRSVFSAVLCLSVLLPAGTVLCAGDNGHLALEPGTLGRCADGQGEPLATFTDADLCADACLDTLVAASAFKRDQRDFLDTAFSTTSNPFFIHESARATSVRQTHPLCVVSENSRWVRAIETSLRTTVILC